ncbi:hypothetical protein Tco_0474095 [Tanacetum coccineum]
MQSKSQAISKALAGILHVLNYKSTCRGFEIWMTPDALHVDGHKVVERFIYLGLTLLVVPSSPLLLSCARLMVVRPLSTSSKGSSICVELRLGRYPTSVRVFPDPILFLAGLKPSWEHGQQRHAIMAGGEVSNDDKGLPDVLELKDATACHLKIFSITPPAWKNHLDNHMDVELLDLHDHCYARQVIVDNTVNRRSRKLLQVIRKLRGEFDAMKDRERAREKECEEQRAKCDAAMTEFEKNPTVVALQEKISTLSTKVKEHKVSLEKNDAGESEVGRLSTEPFEFGVKSYFFGGRKAKLEAVEVSLCDHIGILVGRLVSSAILYGKCRAYEQVADIKEPFDLSKVKGYCSSYNKDHIQASNDLATTTFPWLDGFVADPSTHVEALLLKINHVESGESIVMSTLKVALHGEAHESCLRFRDLLI